MGNKNQNNKEMKFFALIAAVSAVTLQQKVTSSIEESKEGPKPPADRKPPSAEEIAGYIMSHFDQNGDDMISEAEFRDTMTALAKKHNFEPTQADWDRVMKVFNDADADNSKSVDMEELVASIKKHMLAEIGDDKKGKPTAGDDKKGKPTADDKKGKPTGDDKKVKPTAGDRKPPSAEEIAGYITKHFDQNGDGKITKVEFKDTMKALAKKHNYKPTKKDWKRAMKMFNDADVDNNNAVNMEELVAAVKAHMLEE